MTAESGRLGENEILSLIGRAKANDGKAFQALLSPHEERLARLVRYKLWATLESDADTDDIMQETRRKAWDAVRDGKFQYKSDGQFRAWLVQIANNCLIDLLRRNGREPFQLPEVGEEHQTFEVTQDEPSPGSQLAHVERTIGVQEILKQMPSTLRDVVVLRMEGLSFAEIAERLEVTEGAARMRHLRGAAYLRTHAGVRDLCRDWSSIALPTSS